MKRSLSVLMIPLMLLACGSEPEPVEAPPAAPAAPDPTSPEGKILSATSAGPPAISAAATVMDMTSGPGTAMTELRAGTNGWTCLPDSPQTPGNDPMCVDPVFMQWVGAWMTKATPRITSVGLSYMLQGATDASNADPFATEPAAGQDWVRTGPHLMVVAPNPRSLDGMSDDPTSGAPYVMWKGTPYAHLMVPVR